MYLLLGNKSKTSAGDFHTYRRRIPLYRATLHPCRHNVDASIAWIDEPSQVHFEEDDRHNADVATKPACQESAQHTRVTQVECSSETNGTVRP